jgi:hypothetical protein
MGRYVYREFCMLFNLFRKNKDVNLFENEFPKSAFNWNEPWYLLEDNLRKKIGMQRELNLEIGSQHPLWKLKPIVFAKCSANDDILVFLSDGRFACVHLVWNSKIDYYPDKFPSTYFLDTPELVQSFLDSESEEYT